MTSAHLLLESLDPETICTRFTGRKPVSWAPAGDISCAALRNTVAERCLWRTLVSVTSQPHNHSDSRGCPPATYLTPLPPPVTCFWIFFQLRVAKPFLESRISEALAVPAICPPSRGFPGFQFWNMAEMHQSRMAKPLGCSRFSNSLQSECCA